LGHIVCKDGLLVDPMKVVVMVDMLAPKIVKELCEMLGHRRYYGKFISNYAKITTPLEKFLKKDTIYICTQEC